jgi:hypothetical protein
VFFCCLAACCFHLAAITVWHVLIVNHPCIELVFHATQHPTVGKETCTFATALQAHLLKIHSTDCRTDWQMGSSVRLCVLVFRPYVRPNAVLHDGVYFGVSGNFTKRLYLWLVGVNYGNRIRRILLDTTLEDWSDGCGPPSLQCITLLLPLYCCEDEHYYDYKSYHTLSGEYTTKVFLWEGELETADTRTDYPWCHLNYGFLQKNKRVLGPDWTVIVTKTSSRQKQTPKKKWM